MHIYRWQTKTLISRRCKSFLAIVTISTLLTLLGYRSYSLEQRVDKLETLVGKKKITCDEQASIEKVKQGVVRIVGIVSEGSGFFVPPIGLIATNFHVIQYDPNPKIILPDYSFIQGEVVFADKTSDLAFVKISNQEIFPMATFANSDQIEPIEELISVGYAFGTLLRGEPTIAKGHFVAHRHDKQSAVEFIQIATTVNPGASGGPMINVCGEVVGINTIGTAGLGMGISSNYFQEKRTEMAKAEEPLKDIQQITFNANGSPKECVEAFYNYQTIGKLKESYDLLAPDYIGDMSFEEWQKGYQSTLNIILYEVREEGENRVFVKFSSADLVEEDIVYKYFEGYLETTEIDGNLKLSYGNIKEIEKPDWDWFPL